MYASEVFWVGCRYFLLILPLLDTFVGLYYESINLPVAFMSEMSAIFEVCVIVRKSGILSSAVFVVGTRLGLVL